MWKSLQFVESVINGFISILLKTVCLKWAMLLTVLLFFICCFCAIKHSHSWSISCFCTIMEHCRAKERGLWECVQGEQGWRINEFNNKLWAHLEQNKNKKNKNFYGNEKIKNCIKMNAKNQKV